MQATVIGDKTTLGQRKNDSFEFFFKEKRKGENERGEEMNLPKFFE
jgi:hypothetical protein